MSADNRRGGHAAVRASQRVKLQSVSTVTATPKAKPVVTPILKGRPDSTMGDDVNAQLLKTMQEMTESNRAMVEKFAALDVTMTSNAGVMNTHIEKVETHITTVTDDIQGLTERLDSAEAAIASGTAERKQMMVDNMRLQHKCERDAFRLRQIDEGRKRKNIVIEGFPEAGGETPRKILHDLLVDIGAVTAGTKIQLESAFRIGKRSPAATTPRNILIIFREMEDKIKLFQKVNQMRHLNKWKDVYVSDDLTPEQQEERKDLRCLAALARYTHTDLKLKGNKLEDSKGKVYHYRDIGDLPYGISMVEAKVIEFEHGTAFQSHHAYLSNMYKCEIVDEDITWHSSEQLFWFKYAMYNDDKEAAQKLLVCSDGYEAKKISHSIKVTKADAHTKKYDLMADVVEMKFMQSNPLGDMLIATVGSIYECTTEKGWGCGYTIANVDKITPQSVKENKMGEILMKLRDKMQAL